MTKTKRTHKGVSHVLTDHQRQAIVVRLALYDEPCDIHADLVEEGVDISRQALFNYDPTRRRSGPPVAKRWTDLFHATRAAFLQEIAAEPIANRAYRLRKLEEARSKAMAEKDYETARKILETAAKEVGSVFTNVQISKGTMAPGAATDTAAMSDEERRNMLADRINEAVQKVRAQRPATLQ